MPGHVFKGQVHPLHDEVFKVFAPEHIIHLIFLNQGVGIIAGAFAIAAQQHFQEVVLAQGKGVSGALHAFDEHRFLVYGQGQQAVAFGFVVGASAGICYERADKRLHNAP